jgi:hypothetical protein
MKNNFFTLRVLFASLCVVAGTMTVSAQDLGTGTGWDVIGTSSKLLINENFQGFKHFHSDEHTNQGNSNSYDVDGVIKYGYTNLDSTIKFPGSELTAKYDFKQCAFAPEWGVAYSIVQGTGEAADPNPTTSRVSKGFVEISRNYQATGGALPTIKGHFIIDLRAVETVEVIQYTHSSTGGNRRGFMLEFSVDDSLTWDTLRFQPGNAWSSSFTKDIFTLEKTANTFNCQPSANGMVWEDGIYTGNLMLRFSEAGGQTPRIHDLKVYGDLPIDNSKVNPFENNLKVFYSKGTVRVSKESSVSIYTLSGVKLKSEKGVRTLSIQELPSGIYIVKAENQGSVKSIKVVKN